MELRWGYAWFLYTSEPCGHMRPFYTCAMTSIRNELFAVLVSSGVTGQPEQLFHLGMLVHSPKIANYET